MYPLSDALYWATQRPPGTTSCLQSFGCINIPLLLPLEFLLWCSQAASRRMLQNNNKQLDGLVKPKWFASVLSERVGFKRLHWQNIFLTMTHLIFPGGSVTSGSRRPNVWSIDSECKTKNWYIALQVYFKHFKQSSFFLAEFHYF